ncbi:PAS domain-containing protein [Archangium violaceum]|uniref:two-component system sensor histidine kinase NtrB n=1 Tax=Archangium violaceum TaxID=83451 RepID=UPI001951A6A8|nr:ATP-binding protein [Archangium violaceum]QRN95515.1 PAS domain-containing protein [Archangium violaceum]
MRWDSRAWFLGVLDRFLSEEQRRLPPEELGRYRVLVGATVLNLVMAAQMSLSGLSSPLRSFFLVAGPGVLAGYVGVLVLARRSRSPRLPSLLLCSLLSVGIIAASLSMGTQQAATHSAHMLLPALAAYLLGVRLGLLFTLLFGLNALLLQPLLQVGFDLSRPLFPDEMSRMMSVLAGGSFLGGWALNSLHVLARQESHTALTRTLSVLSKREWQLTSLIESTDDMVVALDGEGRLITANQAVRTFFPEFRVEDGPPDRSILEAFPPERRERMRERLQQALSGQRVRVESNYQLGGRRVTLETLISPVLGEGGQVVGALFVGRDITARKDAEARLSEMHRSLLDVSRRAGMAEIATGVLHNVGNTLNSVNVSAHLVTERMGSLRLAGLVKSAELLREHEADLTTFFTKDVRGRQLPAYLQALGEQLSRERDTVLEEMRRLSDSVDHIKLVVSMQQKNARFSGVMERVSMPELIDDALRLHAVSFERLGIQLRREYAELPPVVVDRHKLLQILVNLVSNARHALLDSQREDKQLDIRVERDGERLRISVRDNGVGISAENLERLFTQGFTTKKEGHGFGLHISALTAEEMGGALLVTSAGLGQGATFTLELPMDGAAKAQGSPEASTRAAG